MDKCLPCFKLIALLLGNFLAAFIAPKLMAMSCDSVLTGVKLVESFDSRQAPLTPLLSTHLSRLGVQIEQKGAGWSIVENSDRARAASNLVGLWSSRQIDFSNLLDSLRDLSPDIGNWVFNANKENRPFTLNEIFEAGNDDDFWQVSLKIGKPVMASAGSIKGADSRQLSRHPLKNSLSRTVYWTQPHDPIFESGLAAAGTFDLMAPRISIVRLNGEGVVGEVLVPDNELEVWIPMLYEKIDGRWTQVNRTSLGDDLNKCTKCHGLQSQFGPIPSALADYIPALGWRFRRGPISEGGTLGPDDFTRSSWDTGKYSPYEALTENPRWDKQSY